MNKDDNKNSFLENTFSVLPELHKYAVALAGDYAAAEKLVYKTYKSAFSFYKYLPDKKETRLWLFRILNNIYKKPFEESSNIEIDYKKTVPDLNTFEAELEQLKTDNVLRSISSLPFNLKKIAALYYFTDLQINQSADLLDIPDGVVYSRLFDARYSLLKIFCETLSVQTNTTEVHLSHNQKKEIVKALTEKNSFQSNDKYSDEVRMQEIIDNTLSGKIAVEKHSPGLEEKILNDFSTSLDEKVRNKSKLSKSKKYVSFITVITFVLLLVLLLIKAPVINRHNNFSDEQKGNNNILIKFQDTFANFKKGAFKNSFVNGNKDEIFSFIQKNTDFNEKKIYKNEKLELTGCFLNSGRDLYFIFRDTERRKILMRQIPFAQLNRGGDNTLSKNLTKYLLAGNCYSTVKNGFISLLKSDGNNIFVFGTEGSAKELILEICKQKKE